MENHQARFLFALMVLLASMNIKVQSGVGAIQYIHAFTVVIDLILILVIDMNERIKELAVQAQVLADKFQEQWKAGPSSEEFFHQKVAELIVQECTVWVNDNLGLVDEKAKTDLLKHFGVEE